MMYLALSYDHRLIDGREAVSFLVRVKECIEDAASGCCSTREPLAKAELQAYIRTGNVEYAGGRWASTFGTIASASWRPSWPPRKDVP